uniref:Uncharacterized protein n=1 Tax=Physcomitrium patens TaxID=3218 RepID=A0A2K1KU75_PHYPA|nr:hypothetical protein PHYPA_004331 [Physcomitrium patens]
MEPAPLRWARMTRPMAAHSICTSHNPSAKLSHRQSRTEQPLRYIVVALNPEPLPPTTPPSAPPPAMLALPTRSPPPPRSPVFMTLLPQASLAHSWTSTRTSVSEQATTTSTWRMRTKLLDMITTRLPPTKLRVLVVGSYCNFQTLKNWLRSHGAALQVNE